MRQPTVKKIPFTREAYEELQRNFVKFTKLRVEVMDRLKVAREMGDLSENGAYKYAKFELGDIGRQLRKLRNLLDNGEIVAKETGAVIGFGSTVVLKHKSKEITYMIVTQHESNPLENKLSIESPIGSALKGKKKGDIITVEVPAGMVEYQIIAVS